MSKNILFFYLNTGNGHLAPAEALKESIINKYSSKNRPILIDGLENAPKLLKIIIENGYRQGITTAVWVFEFLYLLILVKPVRVFTLWLISTYTKKHIRDVIIREKPKDIVIFHHLIIKPIMDVIKEEKLNIIPSVIVTDPYTAPPTWFHYKELNYISFSDSVISDKKINYTKFPIILNNKYKSLDIDKRAKKIELGYSPDKKLLLFIGGGDGLPKGICIIKEILKHKPNYQIAYVCGRNRSQYKKLTNLVEENCIKNLTIYAFVNNLHELSMASDMAITKAGASTIMELLITETIPVITRYIWGQEKGNKDFIIDNNLGFYEKMPKKIPFIIDTILSDNNMYRGTIDNIKDMKIENGTELVASFITKE